MKKRMIFLVLAAVLILGLSSCSSSKKAGRDSDSSPVQAGDGEFKPSEGLDSEYTCTIDVLGPWGNFEALDQAAQDFRQFYPNIEIVYSPLNDVETDLKNRMASGKEIDIYMHNWFDVNSADKAFLWENATDLSEAGLNLQSLDQDLIKTGYVDGRLKMMPLYRRLYGFMVNEKLLNDYGMTVPETYEEFLQCCEAFKNEGIPPVLLQGNLNLTNTYNQHIVAQTMAAGEKAAVMKNAMEGKDSFGIVENALKMIHALKEKGYVHPDSDNLEDEYESVILRFFEGDISFVPYNSEMFSGTRKREAKSESFSKNPFAYSFIPFPGEEGYECVYEQLGTMYMGIYSGIVEEKKPYVYELFRYLLSDDGNHTMEHVKNMPSVNINTEFSEYPYFKNLKDSQIFVVGKDGFEYDFSELLSEAHVNYEYEITAEKYLKKSLDFINKEQR